MTGFIPVYLDIETVPTARPKLVEFIARGIKPPGNMKKADTIAAWEANEKGAAVSKAVLNTSFDGAFGEVVVASFAVGKGQPIVFSRGPSSKLEDERILLADLFNAMTETVSEGRHLSTVIVGHDVARFDLRFLWRRAVIHRLPLPAWMPWLQPAWSDRIFDTMANWCEKGERVSLDKLCLVLDLPQKGHEFSGDHEIDGSKVHEYWLANRMDELREYCAWDVERARLIHNLMVKVHA